MLSTTVQAQSQLELGNYQVPERDQAFAAHANSLSFKELRSHFERLDNFTPSERKHIAKTKSELDDELFKIGSAVRSFLALPQNPNSQVDHDKLAKNLNSLSKETLAALVGIVASDPAKQAEILGALADSKKRDQALKTLSRQLVSALQDPDKMTEIANVLAKDRTHAESDLQRYMRLGLAGFVKCVEDLRELVVEELRRLAGQQATYRSTEAKRDDFKLPAFKESAASIIPIKIVEKAVEEGFSKALQGPTPQERMAAEAEKEHKIEVLKKDVHHLFAAVQRYHLEVSSARSGKNEVLAQSLEAEARELQWELDQSQEHLAALVGELEARKVA